MSSILLITGMPGCGKTTMVQKLITDLKKTSKVPKFQGFFTEETRNSEGERIGFNVVTLDGKHGPLSKVSSEIQSSNRPATGMSYKVGKYVVYVREFETLCLSLIDSSNEKTLLVIDEIGRMELFSEKFEASIKKILSSSVNYKILATVPLKSSEGVIDQLKRHPNCQLFHLTKSNRDEIYQTVLESAQKIID